ncbi:MAG: amidohydrolase family protein [Burkholderiales bacterium]|nr:amidohydrolase family protein [Burkholderiales bacterium]
MRPPLPTWARTAHFARGRDYYSRHQFTKPKSAEAKSIDMLVSEMDDANVEYAVVMGRQSAEPWGWIPNDEIIDLLQAHPTRFLAWAGIDVSKPMEWCMEEIQRCLALPGFCGVSIEPTIAPDPSFKRPDDRRIYPIYEKCQSLEIPISIALSAPLQQFDRAYEDSSPVPLFRVAKDFPKLQIHVAHAAFPWVMEMIGVAWVCPNIWLSPDEYLGQRIPGAAEYVKAAKNYFMDRTVFGSCYPSRPYPEIVKEYLDWDWSEAMKPRLMRENALRLMRMK